MNETTISTLFDEKGMMLKELKEYFDNEGESIYWWEVNDNYKTYPADSDIVKLHYAAELADETHGNYSARTLYFRAFT